MFLSLFEPLLPFPVSKSGILVITQSSLCIHIDNLLNLTRQLPKISKISPDNEGSEFRRNSYFGIS